MKAKNCKCCGTNLNPTVEEKKEFKESYGSELKVDKTVTYGAFILCRPCFDEFNNNLKLLKIRVDEAIRYFDFDFIEKSSKIGTNINGSNPAF